MIMRRFIVAILILLTSGLLLTGCSKDKKAAAALQGEVAQIQAQVKQLEDQNKTLVDQADQTQLKNQQEKLQLDDLAKALQLRLFQHPLEEFKVEPYVTVENGWLIMDGEHTFTLYGYPEATRVRFMWADGVTGLKPQPLGEDTDGKNGWSWRGTLPFSPMKAFYAEIYYSGGIKTVSAVLPIRSGGK